MNLDHILEVYHQDVLRNADSLSWETNRPTEECVLEAIEEASREACVRIGFYPVMREGLEQHRMYEESTAAMEQRFRFLYGSENSQPQP